jgi:hypothetical protein
MKRPFLAVLIATTTMAGPARADLEVSGSMGVDVVSAYVFRGFAVNRNWNLQPFVEAATHGVAVGAWWNWNTDIGQFDEVDFYATWDLPLPEDQPVGLTLGYTNYDFPGTAQIEPDREVQLELGLDTILQPTALLAVGLEGTVLDKGIHLGLGAGHAWDLGDHVSVKTGATLGFELGDNFPQKGVSYLQLAVGAAYDILEISLNYVVETDEEVLPVEESFFAVFSVAI